MILGFELPPKPSPLQKRVAWLAAACELTDEQAQGLGLLARAALYPVLGALIDAVNDRFGADGEITDEDDLRPFFDSRSSRSELAVGGRLAQLGLIDWRDGMRLSKLTHRILALPSLRARHVASMLLGPSAPASLEWSDFEHLGELRDLAARIVRAAAATRRGQGVGINLLFYGPPGTGKSEFAKTLGARVGLPVQFVGETSGENTEPNRRERIAALMIANAIGGMSRKAIVVVDEADDLFVGVDEEDAGRRQGSKVFMNRLLEKATAPTIWIANDVERLGQAVVRRMTLTLRFPRPAQAVRMKMISRIAAGVGFPLDDSGIEVLAQSLAPPALIENAIRAAALIGGGVSDARTILDSGLSALGQSGTFPARSSLRFDPALSSADVDLAKLADQVANSGTLALSFCLSGPTGTGKSAYARHLAHRLGLDVLEKRYSDLASQWLGQSEKTIARAFEEAADTRAFLLLDEADSLLRDRRVAQHSWEITQVNEMLTQMERHPYPFACTTNALDLLDAAAARRFLFSVRFEPMAPAQVAAAYQRAFGAPAPAFVLKLEGLTPADFANLLRKAEASNERDVDTLARWLASEAAGRLDQRQRRIGF